MLQNVPGDIFPSIDFPSDRFYSQKSFVLHSRQGSNCTPGSPGEGSSESPVGLPGFSKKVHVDMNQMGSSSKFLYEAAIRGRTIKRLISSCFLGIL